MNTYENIEIDWLPSRYCMLLRSFFACWVNFLQNPLELFRSDVYSVPIDSRPPEGSTRLEVKKWSFQKDVFCSSLKHIQAYSVNAWPVRAYILNRDVCMESRCHWLGSLLSIAWWKSTCGCLRALESDNAGAETQLSAPPGMENEDILNWKYYLILYSFAFDRSDRYW